MTPEFLDQLDAAGYTYLRQLSSEPTENTPRGHERKKSLNRAANTRSAEYRDAFFAAALEILDEETLVEIELNESVMMEDLAHNAGRYARRRIDEIRKQAHAGL